MKNEEKVKAIELRSEGESIAGIAKILNVAKSSVSSWVRDVSLTEEQIKKLQERNPVINNQLSGARARKEKARALRLLYQEEGRLKAREGNLLHQAGCMLYWGEGAKARTSLRFSNSDLNMVKFFIKFLLEACGVQKEQIKISIHCYKNHIPVSDIEKYWLSNLDLKEDSLLKTMVDNISKSSKKKRNTLTYGTAHLYVYSVQLMQHIYGALQEYAKFQNNTWLDV